MSNFAKIYEIGDMELVLTPKITQAKIVITLVVFDKNGDYIDSTKLHVMNKTPMDFGQQEAKEIQEYLRKERDFFTPGYISVNGPCMDEYLVFPTR